MMNPCKPEILTLALFIPRKKIVHAQYLVVSVLALCSSYLNQDNEKENARHQSLQNIQCPYFSLNHNRKNTHPFAFRWNQSGQNPSSVDTMGYIRLSCSSHLPHVGLPCISNSFLDLEEHMHAQYTQAHDTLKPSCLRSGQRE